MELKLHECILYVYVTHKFMRADLFIPLLIRHYNQIEKTITARCILLS